MGHLGLLRETLPSIFHLFNRPSVAPLIRTYLVACVYEIHSRFLLIKGKEVNGYDPSLFKNASDVDLEESLTHHQTKLFDAISVSTPQFSQTPLVTPHCCC
jgi:hypothetical protein